MSRKDTRSIIIDIGSASVGLGLVSWGDKPVIEKAVRLELPLRKTASMDQVFSDVQKTLTFAFDSLLEDKTMRIENVNCFLASPWFMARTEHFELLSGEPFAVREGDLRAMVTKKANELHKTRAVESEKTESMEMDLIEASLLQARLNGYHCDNPFNKKATHVDYFVYLAESPSKLVSEMKDLISKRVKTSQIDIRSFPLSVYFVLRNYFANDHSYIYVDVSGEHTDLMYVQKDVLQKAFSFPHGMNSLIRTVSDALELSYAEALTKIEQVVSADAESVDEKEKKKISSILDEVGKEWFRQYNEQAEKLTNTIVLPPKVFLTADEPIVYFYKDLMQVKQQGVEIVGKNVFSQLVTFKQKKSEDIFLAIPTLYLKACDGSVLHIGKYE